MAEQEYTEAEISWMRDVAQFKGEPFVDPRKPAAPAKEKAVRKAAHETTEAE